MAKARDDFSESGDASHAEHDLRYSLSTGEETAIEDALENARHLGLGLPMGGGWSKWGTSADDWDRAVKSFLQFPGGDRTELEWQEAYLRRSVMLNSSAVVAQAMKESKELDLLISDLAKDLKNPLLTVRLFAAEAPSSLGTEPFVSPRPAVTPTSALPTLEARNLLSMSASTAWADLSETPGYVWSLGASAAVGTWFFGAWDTAIQVVLSLLMIRAALRIADDTRRGEGGLSTVARRAFEVPFSMALVSVGQLFDHATGFEVGRATFCSMVGAMAGWDVVKKSLNLSENDDGRVHKFIRRQEAAFRGLFEDDPDEGPPAG